MIDQKTFILIEDYCNNKLSNNERKAFESSMKNNPELREEVTLSQELLSHFSKEEGISIQGKSVYKKELADFLKTEEAANIKLQLEDQFQKHIIKNKPNKSRLIIGIAASIIILLGSIFLFQSNQQKLPKDLYSTYYNETDLPSIVSRDENRTLEVEANVAFQKGAYLETIKKLDKISQVDSIVTVSVHLYKGVSYMQLDDVDKALAEFDTIINSNSIDSSKGLWFKGVLYLKTGNIKAAKKIFKNISSNSSNFNYKYAKIIYDKL